MSLTKATYAMINGAPANVLDFGAVSNGVTDDTAAILTALTSVNTNGGLVYIPYNTLFDKSAVYGAADPNVIIVDDSSINTGQPPGYKNKVRRTYSNDTVANDSWTEVASSHHPAIFLNNLGTAGTYSANNYYHSIIRAAGFRWNNDVIGGMQWLTSKSPRGDLWRTSDILGTSYNFVVNAAAHWTASTVYALNAMMNTTDGGVWKATTAGTSSTVEPTGTGPTFSDGTVTWTYQGEWNGGYTRIYYDEDGYGALLGDSSARWGVENSVSNARLSMNVNGTTNEVSLREDNLGISLINYTPTNGTQLGNVVSLKLGATLSGATPTLSTSFHPVTNAGATNMTDMVLPSSQTSGTVTLYFTNGNTTLVNSATFILKGGINVTPTATQIVQFIKNSSLSSAWIEISRNF